MFKKIRSFILILIFLTPLFSYGQLSPEREEQLRRELEIVEREIKEQQAILTTKKTEASSISRDIAILNAKIAEAKLKIKKHNLAIERLGKDIVVKTNTIGKLESKIGDGKQSLAQILRKTNYIEDFTIAEVLLSEQALSDFYEDTESFDSIKEALSETFTELKDAKKANETEKVELNKKRDVEIDTKVDVEAEKAKIEKNEAEKKRLLSLNKLEQSAYQALISEKAKKAASIRAALFELRDAEAIPFGRAYEMAKSAQQKTGIRPAFLLAIITQESNLGSNVGSCLMTDLSTGEGKGKNTGTIFERVMKVPRDTEPFQNILEKLNRDWATTPVSCPIGGTKYYVGRGFGGAMGPAQFIPSTWKLFETRIKNALGVSATDPWNPEHAFVASSLYLTDLGGVAGSYSGEIRAACKYYGSGGSSCTYGNQVLAKAKKIQADIDVLEGQ